MDQYSNLKSKKYDRSHELYSKVYNLRRRIESLNMTQMVDNEKTRVTAEEKHGNYKKHELYIPKKKKRKKTMSSRDHIKSL